ncbi:F0F1 ATP synthase subunit B [Microbacteriaceae bacterium]|nr:F0F1 ATP synthase subunit B [Candidatus Saccharibacteria bacterium]
MELFTQQFASTEAAGKADVFATLGIDWTMLLFQIVAFGILVVALGKWVYPIFIRTIDKRQEMIEESTRAAIDAEKNAAKSREEIDGLLQEARKEAREIVTTAKEEAIGMVSDAEEKSKKQAEHIVANAHESLAKEILAAKKALHNETIELVALATGKVVGASMNTAVDKKIIETALKESK